MTINELIQTSQNTAKEIRKEHRIVTNFQRQNPWIIESILNEIKMRKQQEGEEAFVQEPTLDSILSFKDDYLVDSMTKIYRQINKCIDIECPIYFYRVIPHFYKRQCQRGFQLGEVDDMGFLVTGSNLIIEHHLVNRDEFLNYYYTQHN